MKNHDKTVPPKSKESSKAFAPLVRREPNRIATIHELPSIRAELGPRERELQALLSEHKVAYKNFQNVMNGRWRNTYLLDLFNPELQQQSRENLERLEVRKDHLEREVTSLKWELHPISRCPSDILQIIFEWAACANTATNISHVCKRWRFIALRTALLWSSIEVPVGRSVESTTWYWKNALDRVRGYPCHITLIWGETKTCVTEVLDAVLFSKSIGTPNAKTLTLKLRYESDIQSLFYATSEVALGCLDRLVLERCNYAGRRGWNLRNVLDKFPPISQLDVSGFFAMSLTGTTTFPSIRTVSLYNLQKINIPDLFHTFPALQSVSLRSIKMIQSSRIIVQNLTRISLAQCNVYWMDGLECLKLSELVYGGRLVKPLLEFIGRHKSLNSLELGDISTELGRLALAAPQLTHLTFVAGVCVPLWDWKKAGLLEAPFSMLKSLTLDDQSASIPLWALESLVRSRCLPQDPPELSGGPCPIETLNICIPQNLWTACPWWLSEYCKIRLEIEVHDCPPRGQLVTIRHK